MDKIYKKGCLKDLTKAICNAVIVLLICLYYQVLYSLVVDLYVE